MTPIFRRHLLLLALGLGTACSAVAQAWPSKPIRFIVPFAAGGANDLLARAAAEGASEHLGQPILIDNKPGAGGTLGSDLAAKSAPDGYTFRSAQRASSPTASSKNPSRSRTAT